MKAELLLDERHILDAQTFVEIVIWRPARGSAHPFKYRLVLIVDGICVLRYDNEAGKGDHRHSGEEELSYRFVDTDMLLTDFWRDVENWRQ
jgi:hypothetical protein